MARTNTAAKADPIFTHEGARAAHITPYQALRRSVLSCMLWENEFYEDGAQIADRIVQVSQNETIRIEKLADLAIEARNVMHLRHAPLLLLCGLIERGRGNPIVQHAIVAVIQRADELAELVSMYWRNGKRPLSAQMKKGLARAFLKFDAYALGKYNRDAKVKLRDVLFLCHAKADTPEREALWKQLIDGTLASPDTWEVNLSGGADKRETFERLLREDKLGYLALLRNVRGMVEAGVDYELMRNAIAARKGSARVLPFRYVAAARACPQMEHPIDQALLASIAEARSLPGRTVVMVDVSGSMRTQLSAKSDMQRIDAACALGSIIKADQLRVFSFADKVIEVPPRRGMAGIDVIQKSQSGGTRLFEAVDWINRNVPYDRLIVITDEQATDPARVGYWIQTGAIRTLPDPVSGSRGYMINVASAKNGVGYGRWIHLDGFSEGVLRWIHEVESV